MEKSGKIAADVLTPEVLDFFYPTEQNNVTKGSFLKPIFSGMVSSKRLDGREGKYFVKKMG